MKAFDELVLVNYSYPGCVPLRNIMRLPEEQAFQLAGKLAEEHPETTAFYRFADFENYYAMRKAQDGYLYERFLALGVGRRKITPCPLCWKATSIFAVGLEMVSKLCCR